MTLIRNLARPLPRPTEWDSGFWEAARERRLVVQSCVNCQTVRSFPRMMCTHCGSLEHTWMPASGRGSLFSWTILRREFHPGFTELPLAVGVVELDDHPEVHLVTELVGLDPDVLASSASAAEILAIGSPVVAEYEDVGEVTLPVFRLADGVTDG